MFHVKHHGYLNSICGQLLRISQPAATQRLTDLDAGKVCRLMRSNFFSRLVDGLSIEAAGRSGYPQNCLVTKALRDPWAPMV